MLSTKPAGSIKQETLFWMQMIFSTARFSILNNSVFPLFLLSPSFYVYSNLSGFYVRSRTPHMSHIRFASFDISSLRTSSPRTTFGRAQLFRAHALSLRLSASAPLCSHPARKNQESRRPLPILTDSQPAVLFARSRISSVSLRRNAPLALPPPT